MINIADDSLAAALDLKKIASPPRDDAEHLDLVRGLLRGRKTVSKLREMRGKQSGGSPAAAQHVLVATTLKANGVTKEKDARAALTDAGCVGASLESAMAVWSTTKDPNKRSREDKPGSGSKSEQKEGKASRKGGWLKAPRDADDKITGWIEGMMPCTCGKDTGGQLGSLPGVGKHLQKTAGCGLLKPGDDPRVPSSKPTVVKHQSNVVMGSAPLPEHTDVPTSSPGDINGQRIQHSAVAADGTITDPNVMEQLRQLWGVDGSDGKVSSIAIPDLAVQSTGVQQSNVVTTRASASGCMAFAGVGAPRAYVMSL